MSIDTSNPEPPTNWYLNTSRASLYMGIRRYHLSGGISTSQFGKRDIIDLYEAIVGEPAIPLEGAEFPDDPTEGELREALMQHLTNGRLGEQKRSFTSHELRAIAAALAGDLA